MRNGLPAFIQPLTLKVYDQISKIAADPPGLKAAMRGCGEPAGQIEGADDVTIKCTETIYLTRTMPLFPGVEFRSDPRKVSTHGSATSPAAPTGHYRGGAGRDAGKDGNETEKMMEPGSNQDDECVDRLLQKCGSNIMWCTHPRMA